MPIRQTGLLSTALLVLGCISLGCTLDPTLEVPATTRRLERGIVNGTPDPGHTYAGILLVQGIPSCSATLVGTQTVLTAANCVTESPSAPYQILVPVGFALEFGGQVFASSSVTVHPDYQPTGPDVAVVRLQQPISGVTPALLATTPPSVGETVTLVGFGFTSDTATSTFGIRRSAVNTISEVNPIEIVFRGMPTGCGGSCVGDGGGPSLALRSGQEVVVGIHSWGEGVCGAVEYDARVDVVYSWVAQQAQGDLYTGPLQQDSGPPPGDSTPPPPGSDGQPTGDSTTPSPAPGTPGNPGGDLPPVYEGGFNDGDTSGGCSVVTGASSPAGCGGLLLLSVVSLVVGLSRRRGSRGP